MHTYMAEITIGDETAPHLLGTVATDRIGALMNIGLNLAEMFPFATPDDIWVHGVWIRTIPAWVRVESDNDDFYVRHGQTCPMYN